MVHSVRKRKHHEKHEREDMERNINLPERAAYDISRPLYNAIRDACDQVGKQHDRLKTARDEIQTMHVTQQPNKFNHLLSSILESCCLSLQTQISIFEAIVESTKTEPGVEAPKARDDFLSLVGVFKEATKGVEKVQQNMKREDSGSDSLKSSSSSSDGESNSGPELGKSVKPNTRESEEQGPRKKAKTEHASSSSSSSSGSDSDSAPEIQMSTKPKKRNPEQETPRKKVKTEHVPSSSDPVSVEASSPVEAQKPAMKGKGKKISKTFKTPPKQSTSESSVNKSSEPTKSIPPIASTDNDVNSIKDPESKTPAKPIAERRPSFEDISAEVTARLAAKAEKRKSKKESKKRKRESIASSIFESPEAIPVQEKKELPSRKKVKTEVDDATKPVVEAENGGRKIKLPKGKKKAKEGNSGSGHAAPAAAMPPPATLQAAAKNAETNDKSANKSKRRRSSNIATETATAAPAAGGQRKKRKVGF